MSGGRRLFSRLRGCSAALALAGGLTLGPGYDAAAQTGPQSLAPNGRLAVVIGNQDYADIPDLSNARKDAERMARLLRDLGFTVFDGYDVDRRAFEGLLRASILNVSDGAEIVFFYAGHGLQIGRRNYLLPVDVDFDSVYDLPIESMTLDRVIDVLSARGKVHVAIIDACRDNPFPDKMLAGNLDASLFETKTGFDVFQTPLNSLVAFSTAPGMVAFDGQGGENSPYTAAILNTVGSAPEQDILSVFARVRERVYSDTEGRQVPWESSTLVQPFSFGAQADGGAGVLVAQDGVVVNDGTGTRAADQLDLPDAVTLSVSYDRDVPLAEALIRELDLRATLDLIVAGQPGAGSVILSDEGLSYRPVLSERRATGRSFGLTDSFTLAFETNGGPVPVDVILDMEVNACDLAAGDALDPDGVGFYRLNNEIEVAHALEVCTKAVKAHPDTPRFRYQLGRAQQASSRLRDAYESFAAAATAGHVRALNATARLMIGETIDHQALGIPDDPAGAMTLYDRGIAAGDPYAIHSKGLVLLRKGETAAEREVGFDLLDRAAELGHTFSMNELGIYFLTPDSGHFLPERGMNYLEASAARDDIYGYYNLGFVALNGLTEDGTDLGAAYEWFVKAAEGGHPRGPATLGRMIRRDQVPGQGARAALDWYDEGLARGDGWGGVNAANMVLNGDVEGSRTQALIRLAKARHLSNKEAAEAALERLQAQPPKELAMATQALLRDLGADVIVDGAIGPQTRRTLEAMAAEVNLPAPPADRLAELEAVARIYWAKRPTRPDLF